MVEFEVFFCVVLCGVICDFDGCRVVVLCEVVFFVVECDVVFDDVYDVDVFVV